MAATVQEMLKALPKVDRLLEWPEMAGLLSLHPRPEVLTAVRATLDSLRRQVAGGVSGGLPGRGVMVAMITAELERRSANSLRPVINASGVVVHTNLGRSPLAEQAEAAILSVATGYSNLEFDLDSGERGTPGRRCWRPCAPPWRTSGDR